MKNLLLFIALILIVNQNTAQVAINNSGNSPNSKAMLDVSSSTTGMLIPRMTTAQRNTFEATLEADENGMMVFDTETNCFYFYNGTAFDSISNGIIAELQDADGDTKVVVEDSPDEDNIHFYMEGTDCFTFSPEYIYSSGNDLFIGKDAGQNYTNAGYNNLGIGTYALQNLQNGNFNLAFGYRAMKRSTGGSSNVAIGEEAMQYNTTGSSNVAIGGRALNNNTTTSNLVAIGDSALYFNSTGHSNTAVGSKTLYKNSSGHTNSAFGFEALYESSWGNGNTAVGNEALHQNLSGDYNTAIGCGALSDNIFGEGNIAIGYQSGDNISTGSKNIMIGYDIDAPSATSLNQLSIGNLIFGEEIDGTGTTISSGNIGIGERYPTSKLDVRGDLQLKNNSGDVNLYLDASSGNPEIQFQESNAYQGAIGYSLTSDYLYLYEGGNVVLKDGNFGIGTTTPGYRLQVGNSGDGSTARANAWNTFSDRNLKKDLVVMENPTEKLNQLHGYYYYWKDGEDHNRQVGIIAQEVEEVLPEIVSTDADGIKSVDYSKLTPLLIEALKAQQETISDLEARIKKLEN